MPRIPFDHCTLLHATTRRLPISHAGLASCATTASHLRSLPSEQDVSDLLGRVLLRIPRPYEHRIEGLTTLAACLLLPVPPTRFRVDRFESFEVKWRGVRDDVSVELPARAAIKIECIKCALVRYGRSAIDDADRRLRQNQCSSRMVAFSHRRMSLEKGGEANGQARDSSVGQAPRSS